MFDLVKRSLEILKDTAKESGKDYTENVQSLITEAKAIKLYFPKSEDCYHKINLCNSKTGELYSDLFELHILELPKLPKVREKMACGEKMLTCYTITDAGKEVIAPKEDAE